MSEPIKFSATLPMIQSATSVGGDGSSRIKLDVPASDISQVIRLATFGSEKVLRVTVEIENSDGQTAE